MVGQREVGSAKHLEWSRLQSKTSQEEEKKEEVSQEERQRIIDLRRFERKKRHARRPELLSVVKCV